MEQLLKWPSRRFEHFYKAAQKRTLVEDLNRRKDAMITALWCNCLTTDIKIFTQRGWLSNEEVVEGDRTIGYNRLTQKNQWTEITAVHNYDSAEVFKLGNSRWSVTSTPNHRWLVRNARTGRLSMKTFSEMNSESYMVHSAPFVGSKGLPITDTEAAIIGWVLGDGYINRWKNGASDSFSVSICQAKEFQSGLIDDLLSNISHKRSTRINHGIEDYVRKDRQKSNKDPLNVWRFGKEFSMDLWGRAGLIDRSQVEFVASLSQSQLKSFMIALWLAEGHVQKYGKGISQNDGATADAIEIGIYLLGNKPSRTKPTKKRQPKLNNFTYGRETVRAYNLKSKKVASQPVWCVSTTLGTWTAKNDNSVFLTGNSNYDGDGDGKDPRAEAIQDIEEKYRSAIDLITGVAKPVEDVEIDTNNPFFQKAVEGRAKWDADVELPKKNSEELARLTEYAEAIDQG